MKTAKQWLDVWWSEQHDRRDFIRQIQDDARADLLAAINETIADNLHLADGENCTLIKLKRAVAQPNVES
jgi:hypothetical protein